MGKKVLQKEFTKEQREEIQAKKAKEQREYKAVSMKEFSVPVYMIFRDFVDNPKMYGKVASGKVMDIAKSIADIKENPKLAKLGLYDESDPKNPILKIPILNKKSEMTGRFKEVRNHNDISVGGIDRNVTITDTIPGSCVLVSSVYCAEGEKLVDGKPVVYVNAAKFSMSKVRDEVYDEMVNMMVDTGSIDSDGNVIKNSLASDLFAPLSKDPLARSIYYGLLQTKLETFGDTFVFRNLYQKKQVSILIPSENNQCGVNSLDKTSGQTVYGGALSLLRNGTSIAKGILGYPSCKFERYVSNVLLPGEKKEDVNALRTMRRYTCGVFFTEEKELHDDGSEDGRIEQLEATANFVFGEHSSKAELGKDGKPSSISSNTSSDLCGTVNPLYFKGLMQTHRPDFAPSYCLNAKKTISIPEPNPNGTLLKWDLKVTNISVISGWPIYLERFLEVIDSKFMIETGPNLMDAMDYLTRDMIKLDETGREKSFNPDLNVKSAGTIRFPRKDLYMTDPAEEKERNMFNNFNSPGSDYKNLDECTLNLANVLKDGLECGILPGYIGFMDKFEEAWKAPMFTAPRNGKASPSLGEIFNRCADGTWASEKEAVAWIKISWLAIATSWVSFNPLGKYSTYVDEKSADFKENAWEKMIAIAKDAGIEFNWTILNLTKNLTNFIVVPFTRPKISRTFGKVVVDEMKVAVEKVVEKRKREDDEPIPKIEVEFQEDDHPMSVVIETPKPKKKK